VFDIQRAEHDRDHLRRIGRHDFRNLYLVRLDDVEGVDPARQFCWRGDYLQLNCT
jgi:hypothetical protein